MTHHVPEIIPEIERVVLLQKGRVVADGAKEEVLTSEQLSVPLRRTGTACSSKTGIFTCTPERECGFLCTKLSAYAAAMGSRKISCW